MTLRFGCRSTQYCVLHVVPIYDPFIFLPSNIGGLGEIDARDFFQTLATLVPKTFSKHWEHWGAWGHWYLRHLPNIGGIGDFGDIGNNGDIGVICTQDLYQSLGDIRYIREIGATGTQDLFKTWDIRDFRGIGTRDPKSTRKVLGIYYCIAQAHLQNAQVSPSGSTLQSIRRFLISFACNIFWNLL